ncbi:MAG: hypothetical protein R8M38_08340, partial [Mariprofundaceae bacterium]
MSPELSLAGQAGKRLQVNPGETGYIHVDSYTPTAFAVKTTSYTAANQDKLICNTSGAAFTITLPATIAV